MQNSNKLNKGIILVALKICPKQYLQKSFQVLVENNILFITSF